MSAHDPNDQSRNSFPPIYAHDLLPTPDEYAPALLPERPQAPAQPSATPAPRTVWPLSLGIDIPGQGKH